MVEINAKKVRRIFHGEQKVYEDAGQTWLPCGGQGAGTVFMRDNGDGTCNLIGVSNAGMIAPPEGYKFTGGLSGVLSIHQDNTAVGSKGIPCSIDDGRISPGEGSTFVIFGIDTVYQDWISFTNPKIAKCNVERT